MGYIKRSGLGLLLKVRLPVERLIMLRSCCSCSDPYPVKECLEAGGVQVGKVAAIWNCKIIYLYSARYISFKLKLETSGAWFYLIGMPDLLALLRLKLNDSAALRMQ